MALNLHEQQALRLSNPVSATTKKTPRITSGRPGYSQQSRQAVSLTLVAGLQLEPTKKKETKKQKKEQYSFRF